MSKSPKLTPKQIRAIRNNIDLFPAEIMKLPEFAGTQVSRHTIRNYQTRIKGEIMPMDDEQLLSLLRQYISRHGLPSKFHGPNGVIGFMTYLDTAIKLRAAESSDKKITQ